MDVEVVRLQGTGDVPSPGTESVGRGIVILQISFDIDSRGRDDLKKSQILDGVAKPRFDVHWPRGIRNNFPGNAINQIHGIVANKPSTLNRAVVRKTIVVAGAAFDPRSGARSIDLQIHRSRSA